MKIWLIYKVGMDFWINIHGCHHTLDMTIYVLKSAQKWLLATVCTVQVRWVWQQRSAIIGRPSRSFLTALASQGGMVIAVQLYL